MLVWIGGHATHRFTDQAVSSLWKTTAAQLREDKVRVVWGARDRRPESGKASRRKALQWFKTPDCGNTPQVGV